VLNRYHLVDWPVRWLFSKQIGDGFDGERSRGGVRTKHLRQIGLSQGRDVVVVRALAKVQRSPVHPLLLIRKITGL
jgi:hypothetical protein